LSLEHPSFQARPCKRKEAHVVPLHKPLFHLGRVVATPSAIEALTEAGQTPWEFLARHVPGAWGDISDGDRQANDDALKDGRRLLSAYQTKTGRRLWVITEADRSSTCLLLPDEY
jgi:hypothetical protein